MNEIDRITQAIKDFQFNPEQKEKSIVLHTGCGGMDLFSEAMDNQFGFERVYIGKKVPRILRLLKSPIRKSLTKGYYKLWKNTLEHKMEKESI